MALCAKLAHSCRVRKGLQPSKGAQLYLHHGSFLRPVRVKACPIVSCLHLEPVHSIHSWSHIVHLAAGVKAWARAPCLQLELFTALKFSPSNRVCSTRQRLCNSASSRLSLACICCPINKCLQSLDVRFAARFAACSSSAWKRKFEMAQKQRVHA